MWLVTIIIIIKGKDKVILLLLKGKVMFASEDSHERANVNNVL